MSETTDEYRRTIETYGQEAAGTIMRLRADLATANEDVSTRKKQVSSAAQRLAVLSDKLRDSLANSAAANEKAVRPPTVYIPDTTDTDPEVHQDIACVEWHEGDITHVFSAEHGAVNYVKLEPDKEPVSVEWTDPVVAAANEASERLSKVLVNIYADRWQNTSGHPCDMAQLVLYSFTKDLTARDAEIKTIRTMKCPECGTRMVHCDEAGIIALNRMAEDKATEAARKKPK